MMEQVPGMLLLAAVMGLLAACAFSFLIYIAFRRPRSTDAYEDESLRDEALADDSANLAGHEPAALLATSAEQLAQPASNDELDHALTVSADEDESDDISEPCLSAPEEVHHHETDMDETSVAAEDVAAEDVDAEDVDAKNAAVLSAALAKMGAAGSDAAPLPAVAEDAGDWFATSDGTTEFDDFDPEEDDLVVVWDDATGAEPSVEIKRCDEDPSVTQVLMGDVIVAQVRTKAEVDHGHVSLMPLSLARTLGWAQA